MSKHAGRFMAFLFILAFVALPCAKASQLPAAGPPTAEPTAGEAAQSLIPMEPSPSATLAPTHARPLGRIDLGRVAEPGYLDGQDAQYEDGVLTIGMAEEPVVLTGSSASVRVVLGAGVSVEALSLDLTGQNVEPLLLWEGGDAEFTFSGTCHVENAAGAGISSDGSLSISPVDPDGDSLSVSAGQTCVRTAGSLQLEGPVSLNGQTGIEAASLHIGDGPDGSQVSILAQTDAVRAGGDVVLEGVANLRGGQSGVQTRGGVTVRDAFMNLSADTVGIQAGGSVSLDSTTVFAGSILNLEGSPMSPAGDMAAQGSFDIAGLDPASAYTIQEVRSSWGSGRELTDVRPSADGTLRYYTLGSTGDPGRRYSVSVDEQTHTISFDSLSQAHVINLETVALQSSSLPDGVSLQMEGNPALLTLRINNPTAQITLTGHASRMSVIVQAAQSLMLSSATIEADGGSGILFDNAGETELVLRDTNLVRTGPGQAAMSIAGTSLRVVQSGGAGKLTATGAGKGIMGLDAPGAQEVAVESGEVDIEVDEEALSLNGTLSVTGGTTNFGSANATVAAQTATLRVRGGRISASSSAEESIGMHAGQVELTGGITSAQGARVGLLAGTVSTQECVLNTQATSADGFSLQVESTEGSALEGRVLIANTVSPQGLSGTMMTRGPHLIGSLEPDATYSLVDETQVQPVSLGQVRANAGGQVTYYSSDSAIYALVFDRNITLVNEAAYVERTLTDPETGISVFGTIPFTASLAVTPLEGTELEAMRLAAGGNEVWLPVNIRLVQEGQGASFEGLLTITFPIGSEYEGQTLNVIHILPRIAGAQELERIPATVENSSLSVQCATLSPFAVQLPIAAEQTPTPSPPPEEEPEAPHVMIWLLLALIAGMAVWGILVLRKHMRRKRENDDQGGSTWSDANRKGD